MWKRRTGVCVKSKLYIPLVFRLSVWCGAEGIPKPQTQTNQTPTHKYYPRHSYSAPTTLDVPYSSIYNARHLMPKTQILPNLQITFSVFATPNATGNDHLYNTLELLMMGIVLPETCWACNKICNKYKLLHLVGILFPHNNDDVRSKSLQIHISFLIYFCSKYNRFNYFYRI